METLQTPFSKHQLELLSIFNNKSLTENEWEQLKELIADFLANKSVREGETFWNENNWNEDKVEELLKSHLRTPYNQNNQL